MLIKNGSLDVILKLKQTMWKNTAKEQYLSYCEGVQHWYVKTINDILSIPFHSNQHG